MRYTKQKRDMNLEELNTKLHGRDLHLDRDRLHDTFDPTAAAPDEKTASEFQQKDGWAKSVPAPVTPTEISFENVSAKKRRKKIALILGTIAFLVLAGGIFFKVRSMLFSEEKISATLSGPEQVASAELTTFSLEYTNDNWMDLENAKVVFTYPETFQPEKDNALQVNASRAEVAVGNIPAHSQGKKSITGKFYGSKGDTVTLHATLEYNQKNVSSTLTKNVDLKVEVVTSPLVIEIAAPIELISGQDVEYVVTYNNSGDIQFSNIKVKLNYPEGFHFLSAEPKPERENNVFAIGSLGAHAQGKITVRGNLQGSRDQYRTVTGEIGFISGEGNFVAYSENERKTKIIASPLTISQTVNGQTQANVSLGEVLTYDITYKNEGNIGMREAIVTVEIDSPLLNFSRLELPSKGAYDPKKKMISWKAVDVPGLANIAPGQEGKIRFAIPLFATLPEGAKGQKNISLKTVAKIDSPDIPAIFESNKVIGSNALYVAVNTSVESELTGYYTDATFGNSGPMPPVVGKETSYTLHVTLNNTFNDVTDGRVVFQLPSGVRYTGKSSPENEKIIFNERTGELSWDLGTLSADSSRSLIFQVAATPNPNQAGQELPLVSKFVITGTDSFTKKDLKLEKKGKNSSIPEDPTFPQGGATVQKEG